MSGGRALTVSSLLLHAQLKEWYPISCLEIKREANDRKKKKTWHILSRFYLQHLMLSMQQSKLGVIFIISKIKQDLKTV